MAIGVLLKGLGIAHCVVRGGIGDTKSRESAPTVDLRRDALEIVIAQLPQDHPAVLALSYLVRPDVRDAAQAVREAGQAPQTLFKPVAYRKYPDYLQARMLRALRDAIAAGRDVVVDQTSYGRQDVIRWIRVDHNDRSDGHPGPEFFMRT